jgi:hypothetical protein
MITVKIVPHEKGGPAGKLADAELHFHSPALADIERMTQHMLELKSPAAAQLLHDMDATTRPFDNMRLIGFSIWERRSGGRSVTFPARQYSVNGERRSFALLRPITDHVDQFAIRDLILQAYADFEATQH